MTEVGDRESVGFEHTGVDETTQLRWQDKVVPGTRLSDVLTSANAVNHIKYHVEDTPEVREQKVQAELDNWETMHQAIEALWMSGETPTAWPWLKDTVPQYTKSSCLERLVDSNQLTVRQFPTIPTYDAFAYASSEAKGGRRVSIDTMLQKEMQRIGIPTIRRMQTALGEKKIPLFTTGETIHRWAESTRIPTAEMLNAVNANHEISSVLDGVFAPTERPLNRSNIIHIPNLEDIRKIVHTSQIELSSVLTNAKTMVERMFQINDPSTELFKSTRRVIALLKWEVDQGYMDSSDATPIFEQAYGVLNTVSQILPTQNEYGDKDLFKKFHNDFKALLTGGWGSEDFSPQLDGQLDYLDVAMLLGQSLLTRNTVNTDYSMAEEMGLERYRFFEEHDASMLSPHETYTLFLITCMRMPPDQRERYGSLISTVSEKMRAVAPALHFFPRYPPRLSFRSVTYEGYGSDPNESLMTARLKMMRSDHGLTVHAEYPTDFDMERDGTITYLKNDLEIGKTYVDYTTGEIYRVDPDRVFRKMPREEAQAALQVFSDKTAASERMLDEVRHSERKVLAHLFTPEMLSMIEHMRKFGGESVGSLTDVTVVESMMRFVLGKKSGFKANIVEGILAIGQFIRQANEQSITPDDATVIDVTTAVSDRSFDMRTMTLLAFCAAEQVPRDAWIEMQIRASEAMVQQTARALLETLRVKELERVQRILGTKEHLKTRYDQLLVLADQLESMKQSGIEIEDELYRLTLREYAQILAGLFSDNSQYSKRFGSVWKSMAATKQEKKSDLLGATDTKSDEQVPVLWAQCSSSHYAVLSIMKLLTPSIASTFAATYGKETEMPLWDWLQQLPHMETSGDTSHGAAYIPTGNSALFMDATANGIGEALHVTAERTQYLFGEPILEHGVKLSVDLDVQTSWKRDEVVVGVRGGKPIVASLAYETKSIPLLLASDSDMPTHLKWSIHELESDEVRMEMLEKLLRIEARFALFTPEPERHAPATMKWISQSLHLAASKSRWGEVLLLSDMASRAGFFSAKFNFQALDVYNAAWDVLVHLPDDAYETQKHHWNGLLPDETVAEIDVRRRQLEQARRERISNSQKNQKWNIADTIHGMKSSIQYLSDLARNAQFELMKNPPKDTDPAAKHGKAVQHAMNKALDEGKRIGDALHTGAVQGSLIPMEGIAPKQARLAMKSFFYDGKQLKSEDEQIAQMRLLCALLSRGFTELIHQATGDAADVAKIPIFHQAQLLGIFKTLAKHAKQLKLSPGARQIVEEVVQKQLVESPLMLGE